MTTAAAVALPAASRSQNDPSESPVGHGLSTKFRTLRKLRLSVAGKSKHSFLGSHHSDSTTGGTSSISDGGIGSSSSSSRIANGSGRGSGSGSGHEAYTNLRPWPSFSGRRVDFATSPTTTRNGEEEERTQADNEVEGGASEDHMSPGEIRRIDEAYEWEEESPESSSTEVDASRYSWIDPSVIGTDGLRATPAVSRSGLASNSISTPASSASNSNDAIRPGGSAQIGTTQAPKQRPILQPADSYNLLISYQTQTLNSGSSSNNHSNTNTTQAASEATHTIQPNPEWHEMVDESLVESLPSEERKRQGLWWELIKGEREYVRDLRTVCELFINALRNHSPPLLQPDNRLQAFIAEVFSSVQHIYLAHAKLLDRLMERQRSEWPLLTTATDLLLATSLEVATLYEVYMKNYPFAESRIRRESTKNKAFKDFLDERNTNELTRRRDISVFLSRPVTRLPRLRLLLESILAVTPSDHPDHEEIPTVLQVVTDVIKSSQPGIEAAEAKIKLWNVAERLMFKKGEIIELDVGEPKRALVHSGYVYRRVRSETNWHGWQDLYAILLDNYFLLTREEENGKHIVVSRPIHLDFLIGVTADGAPERRWDSIGLHRRKSSYASAIEPDGQSERTAYPFTVSFSVGQGRSYTLCTSTDSVRQHWKNSLESAKTLRGFDLDSNRTFATHTIKFPDGVGKNIVAVDTFTWLGRETIAVANPKIIWLGWKRDSHSLQPLVIMDTGIITSIAVVPEFGWLLVLCSGNVYAYDMRELMRTSDISTWVSQTTTQGQQINDKNRLISWFKIGKTKNRLMVVLAHHPNRNSHQTTLYFEEPLLPYSEKPQRPFRRFGNPILIPGHASDLSFFRQTIAVILDPKGFVIAEPGNPTYHFVPTGLGLHSGNNSNGSNGNYVPGGTVTAGGGERIEIQRMVNNSRSMGMCQIGENEFCLVYEWGACFVTKFGEISRPSSFLRWNVIPTHAVFVSPHLLLFDEPKGRVEVRDIMTGRMCEVIEEKGLKPFRSPREGGDVLAMSPRGVLQLVETVPL